MSGPNVKSRLTWLGPGVVFALTVVGPGDLVSNAAAGAGYGYSLLWALALAVSFRFVWLHTSAKYVLATGESLMDGYARIGPWMVWLVLASMFVFRTFSNLYKLVLLANTTDLLLPVPGGQGYWVWGVAFAFAAFAVNFWSGYDGVERLFKVLIAALGASLLAAVWLAQPDPAAMFRGLLLPSIPGDAGLYNALFVLTAIIGTEAGSLTNVTYSYFMAQKGWRDVGFRKKQRADLLMSVISIFTMGAFVQIVAAGTLHPLGISPSGAEDLVAMFTQTLGTPGRVIFTFGVFAVAFSGLVAGTTGYGLIFADVIRARRSATTAQKAAPIDRRDPAYRGLIAFWTLAPVALLLTEVRPVWLVLAVSALLTALIPVLALALLRLTNDRRLMGNDRNGWVCNVMLVVMALVSVGLIGSNVWRWWAA